MLRYKSGITFLGKAFEAPCLASHLPSTPLGPAELFKIAPGDFVSPIFALSYAQLSNFKKAFKPKSPLLGNACPLTHSPQ